MMKQRWIQFLLGAGLLVLCLGMLWPSYDLVAETDKRVMVQDTTAPLGESDGLCRFGVNVVDFLDNGEEVTIESFDTAPLRLGWYLDYGAKEAPLTPNGVSYVPMIRLSQTGDNSYSYRPSGSDLQAVIAGNPGADWIVGNEPGQAWTGAR